MRKVLSILAAGLVAVSASLAMATTYSALTSMDTQVVKAVGAVVPVVMSGDSSTAFKINGAKLTVQRSGDYYFNAAAQVGGAGAEVGNIYLWLRLNGEDVPDSNSVQTIPSPKFTAVLVSQGGMSLKKGDVLEFVIGATAPGLGIIATKPAGMPAVPSIIFSIFEL